MLNTSHNGTRPADAYLRAPTSNTTCAIRPASTASATALVTSQARPPRAQPVVSNDGPTRQRKITIPPSSSGTFASVSARFEVSTPATVMAAASESAPTWISPAVADADAGRAVADTTA